MHIRGWLTGLIVFLLAPSLLFASLWFYNKFENVSAIDHSLKGLYLVQAVGPLMQEKALTGEVTANNDRLQDALLQFAGDRYAEDFLADLNKFKAEPDAAKAIRSARDLVRSSFQIAKMGGSVSYEAMAIPGLVADTLLAVIVETANMRRNAEMLSGKDVINVWDKMLVPVQGGQFKVAADGASRETLENFAELTGAKAEDLRRAADVYRKANVAYQSEGAKLLSSTIQADTGTDIVTEPVINAYPDLIRATFSLWQNAVDYMHEDLQRQRAETLFAVSLAGLVGGSVIIVAFGIAIALTRALAQRTQQEFENLGLHDPLTGLPNRQALLKTINALAKAKLPSKRIGVLTLDIRQFKKINDQYGDQIGDAFLRDIAAELMQFAEPDDFLSRTGGTEFVLLRPNVIYAKEFKTLGDAIINELGKDRYVDLHKANLDTNIGMFLSAPGEAVTDQCLIDAALAMRASKQKGPRHSELFTKDMRAIFEEYGETAKNVLKALKEETIMPWFQPQVDIHTGEVVGAEALVRWIDKDIVRFPGSFLPAAMDAGYMSLIEAAVRDQTLELAACMEKQTRRSIHFGLNLSADLLASREAVNSLVQKVRQFGLTPSMVSVEILEAVMIDESAAMPIKENIAHLSSLGFHIELDDFGTGHSSISSLRDLKVDRVKIDRSFVAGVDGDPGLQKFTSALINLAKSLDIAVLAEGVETEGERAWLAANGCDVIQGFLISKAIPKDAFMGMVLRQDHLMRAPPPDLGEPAVAVAAKA
ncbi:putative bifunctional diguanylate cyclase/phosphodiesterase [Roseibium denhamense]|uniref:putative bifunctional diguanylate cyclase/phosphodiesterase n=1 Tax=Roseibium denhamense TaxID=76305 RepID=UPI0018AD10D8|nr:bifunctional diguanylate cyclase/phosphodiesterase [Roseibium denhamense]